SLTPVEVGTTIRLNNIFFDNNKSTLKSASFLELDQLYKFLNTNPNVSIEIMGHTDDVGSDDYNLKLSQGRSESVMSYLVEKGISANRLTAKVYGESKPIDKNESEEGRSKNRRVEFSILSK
ncbi:MAG: OmpA family protein, partial [Bacteroidota bacterium]